MRRRYAVLVAALVVAGGIVTGVLLTLGPGAPRTSTITGAVLVENSDARKQTPVGNVEISASSGISTGLTASDSSGFFSLRLKPAVRRGQPVVLSFRHADYQPLDMTEPANGQVLLAYMTPVPVAAASLQAAGPIITLSDIRIRYSFNTQVSQNIGSMSKTFEVVNTNGVPCNDHSPCSPNGRWKATRRSISFDAGEGSAYLNVRVSCISGPCSFTKIQSEPKPEPHRVFTVTVLNWSSTATFLVEAEVVQNNPTSIVRQSYPVQFGQTLDFTLPGTAEGPSIEATLNGQDIVFPLGPELILPWASCTVKVEQDQSKLYRCALKDNYRFKSSATPVP
ncbi:MAG TPA: carboxypeptidase regulatory-like domain-containing protein [Bryobacteraceae bacterium]